MRLEDHNEFLSCEYCGNVHFPDPNADGVRVLDERSPFECPVCRDPLVHAALTGIRLLYCGRCRGVLVGVGPFLDLVQASGPVSACRRHPLNPRDLTRRLTCPKCLRTMDTHPYGGGGNIVIDNCPECEWNWLDYGELQRVTASVARNQPNHAQIDGQ